jgi:hypothetical protein
VTALLVSPKTFTRIGEGYRFEFRPEDGGEAVILPLMADIWATDGIGYVWINNEYVKTVDLAEYT